MRQVAVARREVGQITLCLRVVMNRYVRRPPCTRRITGTIARATDRTTEPRVPAAAAHEDILFSSTSATRGSDRWSVRPARAERSTGASHAQAQPPDTYTGGGRARRSLPPPARPAASMFDCLDQPPGTYGASSGPPHSCWFL
ncbi:Os01g0625966 [Oryza sativa Japonica Group]|uniref:Os01g0625966 protein n=1 Tax=Oryza sativa subsp. japonica TaxID=39947 RepID=A0A0P0V5G1_ORYSJ|nr:Os01g0625966 [Oryza sativa Japonica Group]